MKKISIIILALIGIVLISPLINEIKAVNYYEWVQNGSFEDYINYFEDSGAESNTFNSGVLYGNWSGTTSPQAYIGTAYPHSGLRSFITGSGYPVSIWYNLTNTIIGADVINASFYYKMDGAAGTFTVTIYYDDKTSDSHGFANSATWVLADFVSYINDAKYITAFSFVDNSVGYGAWDDFVLYDVDDDGQYYISPNTKPWYEQIWWSVDIYQNIQSGQKHSGNWSYHDFITVGNEGFGYQDGVQIVQSFIGLDSDTVNDFRLWAKADYPMDLTVMFLYSDETNNVDTKSISDTNWAIYVYDVAVPDKVIVGFRIIPYSDGIHTINLFIDDVSLTATTNFIPTEVTDSDHDGIPDNYDTHDDEAGDEEDEDTERANNLIDWIVMFCVIFLPALLMAGGIYENNQQPDSMHISPIFGIIAGLCLSIGIGIYTTLVPIWLIVLIIIAIVILIVGLFKK